MSRRDVRTDRALREAVRFRLEDVVLERLQRDKERIAWVFAEIAFQPHVRPQPSASQHELVGTTFGRDGASAASPSGAGKTSLPACTEKP